MVGIDQGGAGDHLLPESEEDGANDAGKAVGGGEPAKDGHAAWDTEPEPAEDREAIKEDLRVEEELQEEIRELEREAEELERERTRRRPPS